MSIDRIVLAVAGTMVLLSLLLGHFTAFVGANLLQSAFTGTCPLVLILRKVGVRSGAAF
jgi:hypothetical protein